MERLRSAAEWVRHGHDVETSIADLNAFLSRAGRLRSEYVATGAADKLEQYQATAGQIPDKLKNLRHLTADNPVQRDNCAKFSALDEQRIALMQQAVNLKASGQSDFQTQALISRQLVAVASETDILTQNMEGLEKRLLEERTANERTWFMGIVGILMTALGGALILFWVHYRLLNQELAALEQAQASLRTLSSRLMSLQDEERRRFSRELHDSLGQDLAALKMLLPMVDNSRPEDPNLAECLQIVDKAIAETRTISHLLHPPLLDEAGLAVAVKWYVDGFAQRSKVDVKVDIPDDLGRLPTGVELTLFRILQESLTNIHKHSEAAKAEVSVARLPGGLSLKIRDFGKGVPAHILRRFRRDATGTGVGLAGMRERVRELGGRFEISSDGTGTLIAVTVPVREKEEDMAKGYPDQAVTGA